MRLHFARFIQNHLIRISKMTSNSIVVVGSCMIDFVGYASRLPKAGETIHGSKFVTNFGGKGANQCVAAAKLGGKTTLIARVGDDTWGDNYIENLQKSHVNTQFVRKTPSFSSGIAQINVAEGGENQIVIIAGANNELNPRDLDLQSLENAKVLVLQLETSVEVAISAIKMCKGVSILNGAPAISTFDPQIIKLPTIFCVNETEAEIFAKVSIKNIADAKIACEKFIKMGSQNVIITLGQEGAVHMDYKGNFVQVPSPKVKCIDSTGAGDSFIGALAYFLAEKPYLNWEAMLTNACCVASDSVTKPGTQISFPGPEIFEKCILK